MGVDIDQDALNIAQANLEDMELSHQVDLLRTRIVDTTSSSSCLDRFTHAFDTVIMNPPFGTKLAGIDMVFLERACHIALHTVYSLHKSSTRDYISKKAKSLGFQGTVLALMKYDLPKTMRFHKQKSLDIEVDFWKFERITPV